MYSSSCITATYWLLFYPFNSSSKQKKRKSRQGASLMFLLNDFSLLVFLPCQPFSLMFVSEGAETLALWSAEQKDLVNIVSCSFSSSNNSSAGGESDIYFCVKLRDVPTWKHTWRRWLPVGGRRDWCVHTPEKVGGWTWFICLRFSTSSAAAAAAAATAHAHTSGPRSK